MTTLDIIFSIIGLLLSVAAAFAGIGYFRQGKAKAKLDANTILDQDVKALTKRVDDQANEIEKLTREVKDLHISIDQRDKKFAEAILTLQGKDPQFQLFVEMMKKYIETNIPILEDIKSKALPTITKLDKYLDKQQF